MGCIEICSQWILQRICDQINFNMGCIEILLLLHRNRNVCRLTLTWDVLKFIEPYTEALARHRLTLTWDVLKCSKNLPKNKDFKD